MRLRLIVPEQEFSSLSEKLTAWNATIVSKDQTGSQISIICELDPGFYRDCEGLMMKLHGRYEVLALSVHAEGDTVIDQYDDHEDEPSCSLNESSDFDLSKKKESTDISTGDGTAASEGKQNKCNTCNAFVGDSKQYRDHFKSEWHKHNLKLKTRQLPPLTEDECAADMEMDDHKADLKDYSF
ncbi:ribosome maturation protein SBDS [Prunus yedoensis var. nudiflora]|uniref:Ribosome maturation protein SBDS n=1 Tax=Prunus yedoensis var. nudiflora TaxID=2094558 RepID=A0A314ZGY6_PRUYE|nr:ribosome maturation protein SBDS [Prunus yedoensis var. nudiflora]